jgi:hypothetical protein
MNRMLNKPPRYSGQHTILKSLLIVCFMIGTTSFNCDIWRLLGNRKLRLTAVSRRAGFVNYDTRRHFV